MRGIEGEGEGDGKLRFVPVPELEQLRLNELVYDVAGKETEGGNRQPLDNLWSGQFELVMTVDEEKTTATAWGIDVLADRDYQEYTRVLVRKKEGGRWESVEVDRERSSLEVSATRGVLMGDLQDGGGKGGEIRVFVDHSVVEVFGDDGGTVITGRVYPTLGGGGVSVYWEGGDLVGSVVVHEMGSAVIKEM